MTSNFGEIFMQILSGMWSCQFEQCVLQLLLAISLELFVQDTMEWEIISFVEILLCTTAATRLFDAGVYEQLIMKRTGHRSVACVHSYKKVTDDVLTSSVLNDQVPTAKKLKEEHVVVGSEKAIPAGKENTQPVLNFAGSLHFTLNFHVHS